jgi:hypothetical protein
MKNCFQFLLSTNLRRYNEDASAAEADAQEEAAEEAAAVRAARQAGRA